jgi:hypothetical protein
MFVFVCSVYVILCVALRWAAPPSKEPYQTTNISKLKERPRPNKRDVEPKIRRRRICLRIATWRTDRTRTCELRHVPYFFRFPSLCVNQFRVLLFFIHRSSCRYFSVCSECFMKEHSGIDFHSFPQRLRGGAKIETPKSGYLCTVLRGNCLFAEFSLNIKTTLFWDVALVDWFFLKFLRNIFKV